jgi:hypothetical protein
MNFGLGNRTTHRILFTIHSKVVMVLSVRHAAREDVGPDDL